MQNITLLLGSSIGLNIDASLAHAMQILEPGRSGGVLYINTVQSTRSMFETARKHGLEPSADGLCEIDYKRNIYLLTVTRGDLYKWRTAIKEYLYGGYIQYVIVNSWEYAGKNSRYREEAIFLFKELTDGLEGGHPPVNLMVYAEEPPSAPIAQKIQRGCFGKLSGIAKKIGIITLEEQFSRQMPEDAITQLPEVTELSEPADPLIGTEDEPGIGGDEAIRRFLARIIPVAEKERKKNKRPAGTANAEDLTTAQHSVVESANEILAHFDNIPEPLARMPIHQNNYSPDKAPVPSKANTPDVHSHIIVK
jgi:hypothetical protein